MKAKGLVLSSSLAIGALTFAGQAQSASAESYKVQQGDTFYNLGKEYGVSIDALQQANDRSDYMIYAGETLEIPVAGEKEVKGSSQAVSEEDKELMARLVEAEAKGESYEGKVAVATVVMNRVESDQFPDSVRDVIYESGQFSPVANGSINNPASQESKDAVNEAISYSSISKGALYFYNPDKSGSGFLEGKEVTTTIGDHVFAK
ncbi:LysM peptidoglycan-binding domain-containing protein [Bacillus mangrovi]|uniref:LysM peptidoglycan-binding domain-containing protein n=1 Tax=Metabacillus mangrovi TaxID=1491830 RepID=A0A7X2V527_9BACI|nr:cell wall hydrolase [Metabacillus mangrovi]MTH53608.1 LysM peptidoglycan-binding domain-containing protein [Metabacillus mangrovi]